MTSQTLSGRLPGIKLKVAFDMNQVSAKVTCPKTSWHLHRKFLEPASSRVTRKPYV
jgi:hypothetical protein